MASRDYDAEIKDIADYVANKPIDSELAVRGPVFFVFFLPLPLGRRSPASSPGLVSVEA